MRGIWISLLDTLVFLDEEGNFHNLPDFVQINGFIIVNDSKSLYVYDRKIFTFKEMIQSLKTKMKSKNFRYTYKVLLKYQYIQNERTLDRQATAFRLRKLQDGFEITMIEEWKLCYDASNEEEKNQIRKQEMPNWFSSNRINNTQSSILENEIKTKYNVSDILYKIHCPKEEKIRMLTTLKDLYEQLVNFIDVYKIDKVILSYTKIKKYNAEYIGWDKEIKFNPSKYKHLFHEFYHHIDEITIGSRSIETKEKYEKLINDVANDVTISSYNQRHEWLKDSNGQYKTSGKYKKSFEHLIYWTRDNEIFARLFEDYIYFKSNDILDKSLQRKRFDFTVEEIEKHGKDLIELVIQIMDEHQIFKK